MRFIVDECVGPAAARWLREQGQDVHSVYEESRGADDDAVMRIAVSERRILVTCDKDFGEKIHRERAAHCGVILLRLRDQGFDSKVAVLRRLLDGYPDRLGSSFVVVTEKQIRFG